MSVKEHNRVQGLQPELEEYYRWFHRHPEPSYGEVKTTARIKEILTVHGIEILDTGLKTGLVSRMQGTADPAAEPVPGRQACGGGARRHRRPAHTGAGRAAVRFRNPGIHARVRP
ncbi:hypothetical protein [Bifidobacterium longum]|uniref:hypothetical protein n=1 Tax=Bifidobacterium longum TaxID=216816 RepID=UPI003D030035